MHVMLCYVMLCYVMLCYVMLCYVMLCYVMLCYVYVLYVMYHKEWPYFSHNPFKILRLNYVSLKYIMIQIAMNWKVGYQNKYIVVFYGWLLDTSLFVIPIKLCKSNCRIVIYMMVLH